jgi:hypothetical protein
LALGAFGVNDAAAVPLLYGNFGGFSIGSQTRTQGGQGGIEFFGPTGYTVANGASPNLGQATYGEIGWGVGSAGSSNPEGNPALDGAVTPTSPVSGAPPAVGQPADFPTNFRSALDGDAFSGEIDVNGDWEDIFSLQHYNRSIGQTANSLTSIDIDTLLVIDTNPPSNSDQDFGFTQLSFSETINGFQLTVSDPVFLTVDGVNYLAEFRLILPLTTFDGLTGNTVANGATPCSSSGTVCTAENAIGEAIIQMRIRSVDSVDVLAPPAGLLLGAGVLLLAMRMRRLI